MSDAKGGPALIQFHYEGIDFELEQQQPLRVWMANTVVRHDCELLGLDVIFCSDEYLHRINLQYLDHDTLTDIITFPYQEPPQVEGDLFISIDRVRDNADDFGVSFANELHRVLIHGVLHLCGYTDKTDAQKQQIRALEDEALRLMPV